MMSSSEEYQEGRIMEELAPTRQHSCVEHMQQARQAMELNEFMTGGNVNVTKDGVKTRRSTD
jgi:hypothetical protein